MKYVRKIIELFVEELSEIIKGIRLIDFPNLSARVGLLLSSYVEFLKV